MIPKNSGDKIKKKRIDLDTYVFIDASNIREACRKSCGFNIDFLRLYEYLSKKHTQLKDIRYYEGVAPNDEKKIKYFLSLEERGYTICSLERKTYIMPAKYKAVSCPKCLYNFNVNTAKKVVKMKSNVDVYLTAEMLRIATMNKKPRHIVLISCDGDYAEAIKVALEANPNLVMTVLATPLTRQNNFLSSRLCDLIEEYSPERFLISDISKIAKKISE